MLPNLTFSEIETIYDACTNVYSYVDFNKLTVNSRELPHLAYKIARDFEAVHSNTDWTELDYIETIDAFCAAELSKVDWTIYC